MIPWSLAIRIVTGWKPLSQVEQQRVRPHGPMPPTIFVSSRTPTIRASTRVRKRSDISRQRSRRFARSSEE